MICPHDHLRCVGIDGECREQCARLSPVPRTTVLELDDAQVEIIRAMARPYIAARRGHGVPPRGEFNTSILRWSAEADAAEAVLAKLDRPSGRRLAGPFEPVEGVEWCTVHQGAAINDDLCQSYLTDPVAVGDCNLVTLYIEVQP